jgi:hypothetical protein
MMLRTPVCSYPIIVSHLSFNVLCLLILYSIYLNDTPIREQPDCTVYNVRVEHPFLLNPPTTRPSSLSSFPNGSWCGITVEGIYFKKPTFFFCLLNFGSNTRFPSATTAIPFS